MAHEINPEFKVGCMLASFLSYPYTSNPEDALVDQNNINIGNYFCGDVQIRGEYPYFAKRFFKENDIEIRILDEDLEILKKGKVDYCAFSYYMFYCASADPNQNKSGGNMFAGVENPYLETSEWGWQ